jgi:putative transcriptional regulator
MSSNRARKKVSQTEERRMLDELLEMAHVLRAQDIITKADLMEMRSLCEPPPEFTPERVTKIRKSQAKMSQSVFAMFLNVSVSAVQKWESPESGKHPSGAAAKLLQVIETKGIDAIVV